MNLNIHGQLESSRVNGPGNRAIVWFKGCDLSCPNCFNPESHSRTEGTCWLTEELSDWVVSIPDIEGVTFSGGEPMQQAPALLDLILKIRDKRSDLTIGMFTGYTIFEVHEGKFHWFDDEGTIQSGSRALWESIAYELDFAIMGRYNYKLPSKNPMLGSSNQKIHLFKHYYSFQDFEPQATEVIISPDGKLVNITGFPTSNKLVEGLTT
jgi:anaerobic ribonucleoside-triphosphate reductase activating protein